MRRLSPMDLRCGLSRRLIRLTDELWRRTRRGNTGRGGMTATFILAAGDKVYARVQPNNAVSAKLYLSKVRYSMSRVY